ncbi:MAG: F0F1 ATP synthase subunit alpha, partial [Bacilli bacterium]|nr:F0F1 ATP synthase subunit alpha [Bacilli bacterium]
DYFNEGQRPAIDSGFSVSRVGGAAQTKAMKSVAKSLKIELASYREMLSFSQFGSDLDASTKKILTHGAVLMETLKQKQYKPYPLWKQVFELYAVGKGHLDVIPLAEVGPTLVQLDSFVESKIPAKLEQLQQTGVLSEDISSEFDKTIADFFASRGKKE